MKAKRALILGVSGQDGAYLSRLLLEKGYEVFGASRDAFAAKFEGLTRLGIRQNLTLESVSLSEFSSVLGALKRVEPDEIYNLAGQSSVGLSFDQPVDTLESITIGTVNVLEAIRISERPVRLYSAGSGECFGNLQTRAADESTPFRPRSPYGVAKAAAYWLVENYREAYGLFACTGTLFNHESPLRPDRFVTKKIVAAVCRIAAGSSETLKLGNLDIVRDWGWAPEYVDAMWRMLQQERPLSMVIASGRSFSLREFVAHAFALVERDWTDHVEVDESLFRPTDIEMGLADPSMAAREIGWKAAYAMPDVVRMMMEAELTKVDLNSR